MWYIKEKSDSKDKIEMYKDLNLTLNIQVAKTAAQRFEY